MRAAGSQVEGSRKRNRTMLLSEFSHPSETSYEERAAAFRATYVAEPHAVPLARRAVAELARRAGAEEQQIEAVRLVVSEAVTNAIVHGYRGRAGMIHLRAEIEDGGLSVSVRDEGAGRAAGPGRLGLGMGWTLIRAACERFAVVERPRGIELRMRVALRSRTPA